MVAVDFLAQPFTVGLGDDFNDISHTPLSIRANSVPTHPARRPSDVAEGGGFAALSGGG